MSESQNAKVQQRRIDAVYEAVRLLQYIDDETSYIDSRQKFIAQFPEYAEQTPEEYNAAEVENHLHNLYQTLAQLPIEVRDPVKDFGIRVDEAFFLATRALKRNIQRVFPGDPPTSDIDSALPSLIEELKRRTNNPRGTLKEEKENGRMLAESRLAGALSDMCKTVLTEKAISGDPIGVMCTMFDMGRIAGLIMTLKPEYQDINHIIGSKVHGSEARKKAWDKRKTEEQKIIRPALEHAEKKWAAGDDARHHVMAGYLCNRFVGLKQILGENCKSTMMNKLKPLAQKYDRLHGVARVKKEK